MDQYCARMHILVERARVKRIKRDAVICTLMEWPRVVIFFMDICAILACAPQIIHHYLKGGRRAHVIGRKLLSACHTNNQAKCVVGWWCSYVWVCTYQTRKKWGVEILCVILNVVMVHKSNLNWNERAFNDWMCLVLHVKIWWQTITTHPSVYGIFRLRCLCANCLYTL